MKKLSIILILILCLSCSQKNQQQEKRLYLKEASFEILEGWNDENHNEALIAFKRSCAKILSNKKVTHPGYLNFAQEYQAWHNVCNLGMLVDDTDSLEAKEYFEDNFKVYKVTDKDTDLGLFTGYYEIMLRGSMIKDDIYKYPIYKYPSKDSLKNLTRKEINNGALINQNLELLYTDDPVKLYFLHIQGSGLIELTNGNIIHIGFAGRNNSAYGSIGHYLIQNNIITKDNMSAFAIMEWLEGCKGCIDKLSEVNPSYIFFKLKNDGPFGADGIKLTPERSIAVDFRYIPLGAPIWLETKISTSLSNKDEAFFNRLMVAQDSGSAIKGPIRGDIFFGNGPLAEKYASFTKNYGQYYILLPMQITVPDYINITNNIR